MAEQRAIPLAASVRRTVVWGASAAAAYFLAGHFAMYFVLQPEGIASIWPASGIGVAILLLAPRQVWLAVIAGFLIANVTSNVTAGCNLATSSGFALVNAGEALFGAWALQYWTGEHAVRFQSLKSVLVLLVVTLIAGALSATAGAAVVTNIGGCEHYWQTWHLWFAADGLGMLGLTPIMIEGWRGWRAKRKIRLVEFFLLVGAAAGIACVACGLAGFTPSGILNFPIAVLLPVMLWAGLRFTVGRTAIVAAVVSAIFCWSTVHGLGPFVASSSAPGDQIATLQIASMLWTLATLVLSAETGELGRVAIAARDASRTKSAFLANMSHEIRTPLSAIIGYSELLTANEYGAEERRHHAQTIHRNGKQLLEILDDMLDLSKIEAGKLRIDHREFSIADLIVDVVALMAVRVADKPVQLAARCDGPIPSTIVGDSLRLRQVLLNLVGNAIKFTAHGHVRVRVEFSVATSDAPNHGTLRLHVEDTGIGIPVDAMKALFAPFNQADASHARRFGGTGLGLSICQRLVQLMGGRISVTSKVGVGSTFTVELPCETVGGASIEELESLLPADLRGVALPDQPDVARPMGSPGSTSATGTSQVASTTSLAPQTVLIVDDSDDLCALLTAFLRPAGFEVLRAANGREGIELVEQRHARHAMPDVVLMDMQMPEVDGYQATATLRQAGHRIPILAVTASATTIEREQCLKAGCDDVISKPVDREGLLAAIARTIRERADLLRLTSELPDDSPVREVLPVFLAELTKRADMLTQALTDSDVNAICRVAHQIKGSAASYGFPLISEVAATLNSTSQLGMSDDVRRHSRRLISLCRRVET